MNDLMTAKDTFEHARDLARKLIAEKPAIKTFPKDKTTGIYMLYVNDFSDDHVLPVYVGKSTGKRGVQCRYTEHLSKLVALNRYSSSAYERLILRTSKIDGSYLYTKVLKYIADHGKTLDAVRCVLIEECDEEVAFQRESHWMDRLHSQFLGFNQVDSNTVSRRADGDDVIQEIQGAHDLIVSDLDECARFFEYGFTRFNFRYVLDSFGFLYRDEVDDSAFARVRALDEDGDDARQMCGSSIDTWIEEEAKDRVFARDLHIDSQRELRLQALCYFELNGLVPRWMAELQQEWRRDLLPRDMGYERYPIGDRFDATQWDHLVPPSPLLLHVRFELSARSAAVGTQKSLREPPRIMRVDYFLESGSENEGGVRGGAFIDCDLTRNLSDSRIEHRLKAEVIRRGVHNYGWETWMVVPGLEDAEQRSYLWKNSPRPKDDDWNVNGPIYSLKTEVSTGINGSSFTVGELMPLGSILDDVIKLIACKDCCVVLYSNAVKKAVFDALQEQMGYIPREFETRVILWNDPSPRVSR